MASGQTANGNGPKFDINDPSGWELALVTNPTDSTAAAAKHSQLVSFAHILTDFFFDLLIDLLSYSGAFLV